MPFIIITVVILIVFFSGFRVAQEYQRGVVFRLGRYSGLRGSLAHTGSFRQEYRA